MSVVVSQVGAPTTDRRTDDKRMPKVITGRHPLHKNNINSTTTLTVPSSITPLTNVPFKPVFQNFKKVREARSPILVEGEEMKDLIFTININIK